MSMMEDKKLESIEWDFVSFTIFITVIIANPEADYYK